VEGLPGASQTDTFRPFDPAVAHRLRSMMLGVANSPGGTAYRAFHNRDGAAYLPGVTVGGKTGTAELDVQTVARSGRQRTVRRQHAWFVGFAQKENELPVRTLAFVVLVEDLRGRQTGGQICAPVARELIAQAFQPANGTPPVHNTLVGTLLNRGLRAVEGWLHGTQGRGGGR